MLKHLYNVNDKIIFDWFHNKIGNRKINHQEKLKELFERIEQNIHTLKFNEELKGIWSIDFLYEIVNDEIYLIDMARGFRSAYWNEDKINKSYKEKTN